MALFLFFVNLKCAHKNKQRYFYLKPTKQILELVSLFYKTGYISGFCLLKHRSSRNLVLKITLKYTIGSHGPIDKLCTFSSSTVQKFITYKLCFSIKKCIRQSYLFQVFCVFIVIYAWVNIK